MKLLLSGLVFLGLSTALWALALRGAHTNVFVTANTQETGACTNRISTNSVVHLDAWTSFAPGLWSGQAGILMTPASAAFKACSAGILTLRVSAQPVRNWGALLLVHLESTLLREFEVREEQTLRVRIPSAGMIYLAYPNDLYEAEQRTLLLESLKLEGRESCGSAIPNVQVVRGDASWEGRRGLMRGTSELTFPACGVSTLRIDLIGTLAAGQGPLVEIQLDGETLLSSEVRGARHYNIPIPAQGRLSISMTNGFFQEIADRNLIIKDFRFEPDRPTVRSRPRQ